MSKIKLAKRFKSLEQEKRKILSTLEDHIERLVYQFISDTGMKVESIIFEEKGGRGSLDVADGERGFVIHVDARVARDPRREG